jgi:hypothetical protein
MQHCEGGVNYKKFPAKSLVQSFSLLASQQAAVYPVTKLFLLYIDACAVARDSAPAGTALPVAPLHSDTREIVTAEKNEITITPAKRISSDWFLVRLPLPLVLCIAIGPHFQFPFLSTAALKPLAGCPQAPFL